MQVDLSTGFPVPLGYAPRRQEEGTISALREWQRAEARRPPQWAPATVRVIWRSFIQLCSGFCANLQALMLSAFPHLFNHAPLHASTSALQCLQS